MFYIYVIKAESGRQYTGHTSDLDRRLAEHNGGLCKSTKAGNNWKLVYYETLTTRSEAIKRERWLKTGRGRQFLKRKLEEMSDVA